MNHCQVTTDTDNHYARQARQELKVMKAERIDQISEEIMDGFDAQDMADALGTTEVAGTPEYYAMCEALSGLVFVSSNSLNLNRPTVRAALDAVQDFANLYAKHKASKECAA